jgi:hypothetical protein
MEKRRETTLTNADPAGLGEAANPAASPLEPVVLIANDDPHSIEFLYSALGGEPIELTVSNDADGTL